MINENKLGRSVVMNYTLMHKNIKVADLSLDEETGSIVEIGEIYNFRINIGLSLLIPIWNGKS